MMDIATEPVTFNLYYGGLSAVELLESGIKQPDEVTPMPVDETTPVLRIFILITWCVQARVEHCF